jgi:quercetin dioxygenase-like cupin family protein
VPHGPHKHPNSEFILVREGHLEYLTDGKAEKIGPGDAVFTASMVPHGLRAVGPGKTTYFIVSIGTKVLSTPVTLAPPA